MTPYAPTYRSPPVDVVRTRQTSPIWVVGVWATTGPWHEVPTRQVSCRVQSHNGAVRTLPTSGWLEDRAELYRLDASRLAAEEDRTDLGQFLTPPPTARLLAGMFGPAGDAVRLLDAGAGTGTLVAAFVAAMLDRATRPSSINVTACELDGRLVHYLHLTLKTCEEACRAVGVSFSYRVVQADFVAFATDMLSGGLFAPPLETFTHGILNPPYRKIRTSSETRIRLRAIGLEASNLYAGFVGAAVSLLVPGGELVAITPRSFCNGPYFAPFRHFLLARGRFTRIHVFRSRARAFRDQGVLQENVVFRFDREAAGNTPVVIASSFDPEDEDVLETEIDHATLVRPSDDGAVVYLAEEPLADRVAARLAVFSASLADLGLAVSTGRVVDFRSRPFLRSTPTSRDAPLIYPSHFEGGGIAWPRVNGRKPNALRMETATSALLVPPGRYVLVRRFSAKEERRRVVAAIYDSDAVAPGRPVGFENHLNYVHAGGEGLAQDLARGMAAYLNSSLLDHYFRQFSGHTQVNASDLRRLPYPERDRLEELGRKVGERIADQATVDRAVEELVGAGQFGVDPETAGRRIGEAKAILQALGLPPAQLNERSALTLLALLELPSDRPWTEAGEPLIGITQMMDWFATHYGRRYAPNTRETVRRSTVHQFLQAGLIVQNPDNPARPTNSPATVYRVERGTLELLRTYGTPAWDVALPTFSATREALVERYARQREMTRIPLRFRGAELTLSAGGQNIIVKQIVDQFCPRFVPNGRLVYVGDTDEKWAYFDEALLVSLGVHVDAHGKMPDVVAYDEDRRWLFLIEAVASHGPVDHKRWIELRELFSSEVAGLVFVSAFLDRKAMIRYLPEISWETEVWVADAPTHLIHFDGERFLGPYEG